MKVGLVGASLGALCLLPAIGSAQWISTIMHPDGYVSSSIHGVAGDQRFGVATPTTETRAGIFTGTNTFTSLHPNAAVRSGAGSKSNGYIFGNADTDGTRAARWLDTPGSYEDWTPQGAVQSGFFGSWNGFAGGWAQIDGIRGAGLWHTGPNDFVNLNPAGAIDSAVCAIDETGQYGDATFGDGIARAAKWTGTAGSFVDLSPVGADASQIVSARDGLRSGMGYYAGHYRAHLWTNDNNDILDLHPDGASDSLLMETFGTFQCGWSTWGGVDKASFWNSSAGSYQDLHSALGNGYVKSQAYAMQVWNGEIQIFGAAWTGNGDEHHAVMWTQPVPEPATMVVIGLGATALIARRKRRAS